MGSPFMDALQSLHWLMNWKFKWCKRQNASTSSRDPPITTSMDNLGTKLKMIYEIKQIDLETSNFMNVMYLTLCQFTKYIHQFCWSPLILLQKSNYIILYERVSNFITHMKIMVPKLTQCESPEIRTGQNRSPIFWYVV